MAARRGGSRISGFLALVGLAAMGVTYVAITGWNPLPQALDWLARAGTLSTPEPTWKVRAAEQPRAAALVGPVVMLLTPGTVQARDRGTGDVVWTHDAGWSAVAGDPDGGTAVAVVGRPNGRGFDTVDPSSGEVRWSDRDATAAWTYRDMVLSLACPRSPACVLTAREPRGGAVRWRADLPGLGRGISGGNPQVAGVRPLSRAAVDTVPVLPVGAPAAIGLPVDGGVQVVGLSGGRRLGTYRTGPATRVVVAGGRVVSVTGVRRGSTCRYTVTGRDAASGAQVWRLDGYDLNTADALGCEQHKDPVGAAGLLLGTNPAGMDVLIDPASGAVRVTAGADERIVATDGTLALVRTANRKAVRAMAVRDGRQVWRVTADRAAAVSVGRYGVLVSDPGGTRLRVLDPATGGQALSATTGATVLGASPSAVVLGLGRTVGLLPR